MRRAVALALVVMVLSACSEPLEFADWTIPVPEGTRIIEYADPAIEERGQRIELIEDLVVGARSEDPDYLFFWPQAVAVDSSGRMYVADTGNARVQVYDANGTYLRTLGTKGPGPGELLGPVGLAIVGDRLIVNDGGQRLSTWDLSGVHVRDTVIAVRAERSIFGTRAGSIIMAINRRREDRTPVFDVAVFSTEGTEMVHYARLPRADNFFLKFEGAAGGLSIPRMTGVPSYVAAPSGEVYAAIGDEYQVMAFDPSGSALWALRADRERQVFGEEHKDAVLEPVSKAMPSIGIVTGDWPGFLPTIGALTVDGHGHLYVFPYVFRDLGPDELPVEVYSAAGERLFAGAMLEGAWLAARGDLVYALRENEQTDEQELVRYRLVEPF